MELSDSIGKEFSYVRWLADDTIHRISDITTQAKSDVGRLIIVGVLESAYSEKSEDELGESGRILVRYSGTEKKIRVLVEAKDSSLAKKYAVLICDHLWVLVEA